MDQIEKDQGWQQLQDNIEGFLGQFREGSTKRTAYKPRFAVHMAESPDTCEDQMTERRRDAA